MDARCPKCEKVATFDIDMNKVKCFHCNFEAAYDDYIEIMKENAVNMAVDYIPDRPGF
jgi:phage FluMu protein Com